MTDANQPLQDLMSPMLAAVNAELHAVLDSNRESTGHLHNMMRYHLGWIDEAFQPASFHPGKQIRPLVVLLSCAAAGGSWERAVPAGAAVELLHNFSLIHDDIEDDSPTRRGRATLWSIWGVPLAINAGDAMFALAHLALQRLSERGVDPSTVLTALRRFDETCIHLTQGQHADMRFETRGDVSVGEYIDMITGKTSVLLGLCAELGALIGGAGREVANHYAQFGLNVGLAFQVQDDILGVWGDEAAIGKSATSDITTRKKTLPVLYGLEQSAALRSLYETPANPSDFVEQVIAQLDSCGARTYAEEQANLYTQRALAHLEAAAPTNQAGKALLALTHKLLKRQT